MRTILYSHLLLVFLWLATGCEKEVKVHISSGQSRLVVEGAIETGLPPYVILTRSIGYFSQVSLGTLQHAFVHDATVRVSDGAQTLQLREYSVDTGNNNTFSFYSVDTADLNALNFLGQVGKTYSLSIDYAGENYQAVTTIPNPQPVDAIWFDTSAQPPQNIPLGRLLYIHYTDPDTPGNCVRYFTRRNSEPYYAAINSVYDDEIVNGTAFNLNLPRGYDRSRQPDFDSLQYFFVGDTVTIKWCSIDKKVFDFWRSFEIATGTVGNPFAAPIQVSSNISNGALGVWAGYGSTFSTIVITK